MRITALVAAAALAAAGSALATQSTSEHGQRVSSEHGTVAVNDRPTKAGGIVDKTKRALHRLGDKVRSTGHRVAQATHTDGDANRNDTRAMGAAGSDREDAGRRQRMDDAYANWRAGQKH